MTDRDLSNAPTRSPSASPPLPASRIPSRTLNGLTLEDPGQHALTVGIRDTGTSVTSSFDKVRPTVPTLHLEPEPEFRQPTAAPYRVPKAASPATVRILPCIEEGSVGVQT